jgi:hypothetical protein
MENENINQVTFYEKVQVLIDNMHSEAHAAKILYENRPDKESTSMPLVYGEASGLSKGLQQYANEFQRLLVTVTLGTQPEIPKTILDKGIELFGDEIKFRSWYNQYCFALEKKPSECSEEEILCEFGKLDHGILA